VQPGAVGRVVEHPDQPGPPGQPADQRAAAVDRIEAPAPPGAGTLQAIFLAVDGIVGPGLGDRASKRPLDRLVERGARHLDSNAEKAAPGLDRVTADLSSYYEIAYAPQNTEADGKFRKIEVKVARKSLDVTSRSGYFALPATDTAPLLPFELPLLAAAARAHFRQAGPKGSARATSAPAKRPATWNCSHRASRCRTSSMRSTRWVLRRAIWSRSWRR